MQAACVQPAGGLSNAGEQEAVLLLVAQILPHLLQRVHEALPLVDARRRQALQADNPGCMLNSAFYLPSTDDTNV